MTSVEQRSAATTVPVPDHVPSELVRVLDHHNDPAALADPSGYLDGIRPTQRAFYSPVYEGFWVLTRYEDIREALQRPEQFTSAILGIPGWAPGGQKLIPITMDPPEHTKYRALINAAFSPRRVRAMEGDLRRIAGNLIDGFKDDGSCEFVTAYAEQFSAEVFTRMLGLPLGDAPLFRDWNNALLHPAGDRPTARDAAAKETHLYLAEAIAQRRSDPDDALISGLLAAEVDGEVLTDTEVLGVTFILFMAGLDTVASAHAFAWHLLAQHPVQRAEIVDDPACRPDAIEEMLRYNSIFADSRTVTDDLEFADVTMKAGDRVLLPTFSADRDESVFEDPLTVDFHRAANPHLAFGAGPHRCIGSHLARLELSVSLDEWHARIPDYRVPEGGKVIRHAGNVTGLGRLPLEWPAT